MSGTIDGPPRQTGDLKLRVMSSVVLIALALACAFVGGVAFRLLAAVMAVAMLWEWCAMAPGTNQRHLVVSGLIFAAVLVALVAGYPALTLFALLAAAVAVCALTGRLGGAALWAAGGIAYAGIAALSLGLLRSGDQAGLLAVLFLFAVVWATDIFAYFVGRGIGGPKLAPKISPGKTQSGAIGGAVGGVVAGLLLAAAAGAGNLGWLALVALVLSLVAQAGDLFESWLKRRHHIKDSGRLIPGHGGVMDRVDGLVAAAFALYVIGWLSGGADNPAQGLFAI